MLRPKVMFGFDGPAGDVFLAVARVDSAGRVTLVGYDPPGDPPPPEVGGDAPEMCACGCRRRLHPQGPSLWFASQACQRRWASARADAPDEVYDRPDAATPTPDAGQAPLTVPFAGRSPWRWR